MSYYDPVKRLRADPKTCQRKVRDIQASATKGGTHQTALNSQIEGVTEVCATSPTMLVSNAEKNSARAIAAKLLDSIKLTMAITGIRYHA